jgi:hypothetical protein
VHDQRAYLVQIATRRSLDRLRTMKRRKEAYVGPWLPEPLLTCSSWDTPPWLTALKMPRMPFIASGRMKAGFFIRACMIVSSKESGAAGVGTAQH